LRYLDSDWESPTEYHGLYKEPTQATAARQSFNLLDNNAGWPGCAGANG